MGNKFEPDYKAILPPCKRKDYNKTIHTHYLYNDTNVELVAACFKLDEWNIAPIIS